MSDAVLMILTSQASLGGTGYRTGSWLEELAAPYYACRDAGLRVDFASIAGGVAPVDPLSEEPAALFDAGKRFLADSAACESLLHTAAVASKQAADYAAVFCVGGSGTAWDFPRNVHLTRLIEDMNTRGALIAAVCHGVLALCAARAPDGLELVKGRKVTGLSVCEDQAAGLAPILPVLPEVLLKKSGAIYLAAAPFQAHVVCDGNLLTGQNPASALPLAQALVRRLTPAANAV